MTEEIKAPSHPLPQKRRHKKYVWPKTPGTPAIQTASRWSIPNTQFGAIELNFRKPRTSAAVFTAQMGQGTGLPVNQGIMGLYRKPHRGAVCLRMA